MSPSTAKDKQNMDFDAFKTEVINDYKLAYESRQASLLGRKEVLTGKAKFGIFGDGKEVAQLAMAKAFQKGDYRSGYYRDQTFMFATGMNTIQQFFAQLYAHTDIEAEPNSAGRSMNGHFGSRMLDENGHWLPQTDRYNSTSDISPTAGQMPRLLGLALASKLYKQNTELHQYTDFSNQGNEVAFGTIGNASTSEGGFWEVMNAAGVLQVPLAMSVWDDAYGISVPAKYQTTKENISAILSGFQTDELGAGIDIFKAKGWDYAELCQVYKEAIEHCRVNHRPVLIHVSEVTQPQGHSTSGSHERYKSKERLQWELDFDCIKKMREWIEEKNIATADELNQIEAEATELVNQAKKQAWEAYLAPLKKDLADVTALLETFEHPSAQDALKDLKATKDTIRKDLGMAINKVLMATIADKTPQRQALKNYYQHFLKDNSERYSSHLHSESNISALSISEVKPEFNDDKIVDGREVVLACFDAALQRDPRVFAFGEDVGAIGDVNQGFAGMQEKYGEIRVSDTGIRELSIIGQGIGAAMRGLRPIAEIQYLDYLLYALQIMSDDIATIQYRTKGGQKSPIIIRTRGHRLEGIWHSGSPMGMIINAVRGMYVCVPRNMTQAAGMYNLLLQADEPALVVECLNGYRLKEKLPSNIDTFTVPLGVPEILKHGKDVTIVGYGSTLRIIQDAMVKLESFGIECELIDVQTLLPFDINHSIVESLKKTNKVVFIDEDVPGGATAYMMQKVLEEQAGYQYLDAAPLSISAKAHRPAYSTDGDYFSKPNAEDIFIAIYNMMHEYNPNQFGEW
ncbi:MAG: thiamine pyrophosphate-dependent enzyme [Bacteroidota bacterium]|nr:thiamine pyrophosphate-dependent enzyme [Bacteroidota bacterium]